MAIDIEIQQPNGEWWPFTASKNDPEQHGRELFVRAESGEFGEIAPFENIGWDEPSDEELPEITATPESGTIPSSVL